jgi:thioredoxin-related protein
MRTLTFLLLMILTLNAEHVSWYSNFDKAHQEAVEQKKGLMVLLIQKNCLTCKEVIQSTFMNQDYIYKINTRFIAVLITKGQKSSYPIEMLYTSTYPSLFFLDSNELFLYQPLIGDITPDKLKSLLSEKY